MLKDSFPEEKYNELLSMSMDPHNMQSQCLHYAQLTHLNVSTNALSIIYIHVSRGLSTSWTLEASKKAKIPQTTSTKNALD